MYNNTKHSILEIKKRISTDYVNEFNKVTGKQSKLPPVLEVFITALSYIFFSLYKKADSVISNAIPSEINDMEVLKRYLTLNGIEIKPGSKAKGKVRITANQKIPIAAGTQLVDVRGNIYETITNITSRKNTQDSSAEGSSTQVTNGWNEIIIDTNKTEFTAEVGVQAEIIGASYNQKKEDVDLLLTLTNNAVESITVIEDLKNGVDVEDFFSAKERLLDYYSSPKTGGTKSDYERWVKSVTGIDDVAIFSVEGNIRIVPISKSDVSFIPTTEQIDAVKDHLEERAPLGVTYVVTAPISTNVTIKIEDLEIQDSVDQNAVIEKISEAINSYFSNNVKVGMMIVKSNISATISAVEGEVSHTLSVKVGTTSLSNENSNQLTVGSHHVPTITITPIEVLVAN